jgi:hypothetical protein
VCGRARIAASLQECEALKAAASCTNVYLTGFRDPIASQLCPLGTNACVNNKHRLASITFEYTGRKLLGTFKDPNPEWNHLQGMYDAKGKEQTPNKLMSVTGDKFPDNIEDAVRQIVKTPGKKICNSIQAP